MENEEEFVPDVNKAPDGDPGGPVEFGLDNEAGDEAPDKTPRVAPSIMRIGDYEVIRELGRGGMGIVYKARQRSLHRIVALKMILVTKFASEVERLRFFQEAEVIASLSHPNIVSIHEIGEHEGQPFFSMDFIEGTSLKDLVQTNPLPWSEAARFALLIAQAMEVAHAHGVIHRDLKPQNILVDSLRNPHVVDFGLARNLNADSGLTMTGAYIGTPNYMSPEQSSGTAPVFPSTDVYAIGGILYEMLTTLPPFISGNLSELLDKVKTKDPLAPKLINPSIPRDLNTVCLKCLQKDPERRYQSAAELAEELNCVLRDIPIKAKPVGAIERGWRWCKRNRALASVITGATAIILLGTTTAFIVLSQEIIQANTAVAQANQANQDVKNENKELETVLAEMTHANGTVTAKRDAEQDLVQAIQLFHELHLSEAQAAADQVVAAQPSLPGGWYLRGQLALVQENLPVALKDLQIAARAAKPNGLDPTGQALLALVNQYALKAQQMPDGKLGARDALDLLRNLQGSDEYFALVAAQQKTWVLLLQSISTALDFDSKAQFAGPDHVSIASQGNEVILTLRDIPDDPDLSAIRNFPIFTILHIENTNISYLGPFTGMQLSQVDLIRSPITSLDALKGMHLHSLTLKGTRVQDLTPLRGMNVLRRLDLSDTGVSNLVPLAGLNLESLSLRNTAVKQIACLKGMPLQELDLRGCKILDLNKFTKLPPIYFAPQSK